MAIDVTNPWYAALCGLIVLEYVWSVVKYRLSDRMLKRPLPAEVADIYDAEAYAKWLSYRRDGRRLSVIEGAVMSALTLALFATNAFSFVYYGLSLDTIGSLWGGVLLMVMYAAFSAAAELPFNYYATFVIEETYGFNRSSKKTFWLDALKGFAASAILNAALAAVATLLFDWLGLWAIAGIFGVFVLITVAVSALAFPFMHLSNKFTPLEEGSLKQRLVTLFTSNGYRIGTVYVMDASRRTTKVNAFCTGLGKLKKVALFDNLVNHYTEDEITAVFAHELGHAKHRDTLTLTATQLILYAGMAACIGWMVSTETVSAAMGFEGTSMTAVLIALLSVVFEPLMTVLMIPMNLISRAMENRADRFAAENGLGDPLIHALKQLSRDNFSNLNPHPFLSYIGDSHPTVAQRIRTLRKHAKPGAGTNEATDEQK